MRFAATVLLWLLATAALAVAIPTMWAQHNIVDEDGYAVLARQAADDPALQSAMASELTTRAMALIAEHGASRQVDGSLVDDAAAAFTAGPSFPPLFVQVNRAAHRWLFTEPQLTGDQWVVDVAPMLKDSSLQQILERYQVKAPDTLKVPLTVSGPHPVRQGQLHRLAVRGPWVSVGAAAASAVCALLLLMAARRRGKALTSLGVSALLVGAAGWAGIEIGRRLVNDQLNQTTGDIRRMADVMVGQAEDSLHQWLNVTLVAGAVLVVVGVVVAVLGGLFRRDQHAAT
ncbi:hypothetical protein BST27_26560 [Mycobacterium intermedium]|uniref:Uncharacterized protein n=1 Tax=Mycobacterium intermedium TaxID=28445 RepID=A0A1E3S4Z4_MYCIE|nr:hypothetical protein [Mycobacterium intermedium]MCV6966925.1 hypothetical protein [Mycobacterium intermedium]ODQ97209.1 hypothetical protein BHQ20_27355 [Mycobacterium intermedium]OPE47137.1 hypothetical protein BV508_23240 [Mycobacterium intermedium]ORA95693.1 hypothetical protein BST27_26560 [Mycobacterium intermedium]